MPQKHFIIYCDESDDKGRFFSNFYGGALIEARDREAIERVLFKKKTKLNLHKELKWTKITENYEDKYIKFIERFFDLVQGGHIKIRIMFTQNIHEAQGLEEYQIDNQFFMLYYQMIKNAFGLRYCNPQTLDNVQISLLLDDVPDSAEKFLEFKHYLHSLCKYPIFSRAKINIAIEDISEVDSASHIIMQGLDTILGAMQFRLNDKHLEKPEGKTRRGKRTRAKERVYKYINSRIRSIYPGFNIGVSTGQVEYSDKWTHAYRHWRFVPNEHEIVPERSKNSRRK
jgi:hypothetical protein